MRKGAERMNKSRVTEYILAYMQEKGISASEISEQTQVPFNQCNLLCPYHNCQTLHLSFASFPPVFGYSLTF